MADLEIRLERVTREHDEAIESANINTTLLVLDIPETARAKWCSFHLVIERQDNIGVLEFIELWSLETLPVEFKTTWNTRPSRKLWLGTIQTRLGVSLPPPNAPIDSKFNLHQISVPFQLPRPGGDGFIFPCQLFIGKTGFELAALPTHYGGFQPWTWRTPGLMVEIYSDSCALRHTNATNAV